jgi:hypothetical protein
LFASLYKPFSLIHFLRFFVHPTFNWNVCQSLNPCHSSDGRNSTSSTATDRSRERLHTKHRLVVQRERHINTTNCIHS